MSTLINLVGKKFGKLTVISRADDYVSPKGVKEVRWLCKCDCGKFKTIYAKQLRKGLSKSCGCLQRKAISTNKLFLKYEDILYSFPIKLKEYKETNNVVLKGELEKIQNAINKLDKKEQKYVMLKYFECKCRSEVSSILGIGSCDTWIKNKSIFNFIAYYENLI